MKAPAESRKQDATARPWRALATRIAGDAAEQVRERLALSASASAERVSEEALDFALAISCAYPAYARPLETRWDDVVAVTRAGTKTARDARAYRRLVSTHVGDATDVDTIRRALRVFARRAKLRVAARELMPYGGSDVDVTARELSDLADVSIHAALSEALGWADSRWGLPLKSDGERCAFVVIGMGKLGGRELNPGSDVDLMLFYETDEGSVVKEGVATDYTLHEHFTRVAQRLTATLGDVTDDGFVFRVDLRLRPEGSQGPLVNALLAAERYYETWGRTWERAALLRARPCAGDVAFGKRLLEALSPFVWRRGVDPRIAREMAALVAQARDEAKEAPERDLKLGRGGIREAEFFVQSLQLIWGGREPSLRSPGTFDALKRLRARGFVTDREAREMTDAYVALRRLEHRVQFATGLQTHALPSAGELLETIARSLGFAGSAALEADVDRVRKGVEERLLSLTAYDDEGASGPGSVRHAAMSHLLVRLDARDEPAVLAWLIESWGPGASPDLARHLVALARRPDFPLGAKSRDAFPELAPVLLGALVDAADPEQAARLLSTFFARVPTPSVYARMLAGDPWATRRMATLFGASAFLGEAVAFHPELADGVLFNRGVPDPTRARTAVEHELATLAADDARDPDAFVGALRRAKGQVLIEVGLADLAGELEMRDCTLTLSALADTTLEKAAAFVDAERRGDGRGLAVIAMGKLGGKEIGYGSDLDLFFVYREENDPAAGADDRFERSVRQAQRVLRILSAPHGEGPGYELDTRLRPSGQHGLLVVSREAFARYHGLLQDSEGRHAEDWERQALIKARFVAGDAELGEEVIALAHRAAYDEGAPAPERIHHLRLRMERELGAERRGEGRARYDLKLGHGGLVDVEFAVQWLQMKHGRDLRVRTSDTELALSALEACGYLDAGPAAALRDGYQLLRRLEQRLRVLHGTSAQWIEEGAPGLAPLARRMGMRDGPWGSAAEALLARYRVVTEDVRGAYLAVIGAR